MSKKNEKKSNMQCPVPQDIRDKINEIGDVVEKHRNVARKFGLPC